MQLRKDSIWSQADLCEIWILCLVVVPHRGQVTGPLEVTALSASWCSSAEHRDPLCGARAGKDQDSGRHSMAQDRY